MKNISSNCGLFESNFSNLFLYGNTGLGKTFLSHCIAKELLDQGHFVVYFSAVNFFDMVSDRHFARDEEADTLYKRAAGIGELINLTSKAMKGGKSLMQVMRKGKALTPAQIDKMRRFVGNSDKIKQFGKQYFKNEAEVAKMRQFLGIGAPKTLPAVPGGGALVPASSARALPTVPAASAPMVPRLSSLPCASPRCLR